LFDPRNPTFGCIICAAAAEIFAEQIDASNCFVEVLAATRSSPTSDRSKAGSRSPDRDIQRGNAVSLGTIILIILIIILLGGFSGFGGGPFYGTGYYGGGGLGVVIVILLILILLGRI
jgi:hypothetical protein